MALGGVSCPATSSRVPKLHPCSAPEPAPRFTGSPCPCTSSGPGTFQRSNIPLPDWNFPAVRRCPQSWCLSTRGCSTAAESMPPGSPTRLPKRVSRARRCPPRGFIAPLRDRYRGSRSTEGRRGLCAGTRSPGGNRPRVGIPVRSSGEVDWERARAGGLGKVSAPFHPCLAHGCLPRHALAGFTGAEFGVDVPR